MEDNKVRKNIGIAQMEVSDDQNTVLCAPNLGSCLGISIFDRKRHMGGMIHCLLPHSKSDPEKAKQKPWMYVDTGVVSILNELLNRGCKKEDLEIIVAGGSQINDTSNVFQIGKKNFTILRKILWKNDLLIKAQDVGSNCSRTLSLHLDTGKVTLRKQGEEVQLN